MPYSLTLLIQFTIIIQMQKESQQLGLGGEFASMISEGTGIIEANKSIAKEQTPINELTPVSKDQLRFWRDFPIIPDQIENPASLRIKLASSEGQIIFNKETVTDFFNKLFPNLFKIERGEKVTVPFKNGGGGEVKISTSIYTIFAQQPVRDDKLFILEVPALVSHPRYSTVWTIGFKSTLDPNTKTKVREFDHPRIFYDGSHVRKVTKTDLDEFVDIWRRRTAKEAV
jgi:hypothetical protein